MSAYIQPIREAIIFFPFIALFISSFFFVYQYHKYGTFNFFRGIILYSFVFYLLCTYFLVILPLPPIADVAKYTGPTMELQLGASLKNFLEQTVLNIHDPSTYLPAIKQNVFLEPMFNILILLPFGVYLRYYFNFSLKKTILFSFLLSLFFELTQLTGLYFIYPRSYRLFDVNDLLHNTLGGTLGYLIEPVLTFILPTREKIDAESYQKGKQVSFLRRFFAWLIDWGFLTIVSIVAVIIVRLITQDYTINFSLSIWWYLAQIVGYFFVLNYLLNGQTLGKKLVQIRVVEEGRTHIRFSTIVKRYGILYLFYLGFAQIVAAVSPQLMNSHDHLVVAVSGILTFVGTALQIIFVVSVLWGMIRKKRRLFYETATDTYTISTIKVKEDSPND